MLAKALFVPTEAIILRPVACRLILLCCFVIALTSSCVKLPRDEALSLNEASGETGSGESVSSRVSVNRASREELTRLPGVGPGIAARIVEHRERYGPFRRAEHLMMVRGISERRFRQMRDYITLE